MTASNWVKCPVCNEPDMRQVTTEYGSRIECTNLVCRSNFVELPDSLNKIRAIMREVLAQGRMLCDESQAYVKLVVDQDGHAYTSYVQPLALSAPIVADMQWNLAERLCAEQLDLLPIQASFSMVTEHQQSHIETIATLAKRLNVKASKMMRTLYSIGMGHYTMNQAVDTSVLLQAFIRHTDNVNDTIAQIEDQLRLIRNHE